MNKSELIAAAKAQWTQTEASIAKAASGKFNDRPSASEWSAAEIYRHLVDTMHKLPEAMEQLVKDQPMTVLTPGDAQGLEDFKHLHAKLLPIELNTAHGIVWMALQKLTDADLSKKVDLGGNPFTLEQLTTLVLIQHEQQHVAQALAAAGVAS
jgi:hypothetical protein